MQGAERKLTAASIVLLLAISTHISCCKYADPRTGVKFEVIKLADSC